MGCGISSIKVAETPKLTVGIEEPKYSVKIKQITKIDPVKFNEKEHGSVEDWANSIFSSHGLTKIDLS
jgi:hypothetical protein